MLFDDVLEYYKTTGPVIFHVPEKEDYFVLEFYTSMIGYMMVPDWHEDYPIKILINSNETSNANITAFRKDTETGYLYAAVYVD